MTGILVPPATSLLLGAVLVAASILMVIVISRAGAGRLGPNRWVGLRTRETLAGPRQWRAAHEAARGAVTVGAIGMAMAGLSAAMVRDLALLAGVVVAGAVWGVIWALVGLMRGEQAARDVLRRR